MKYVIGCLGSAFVCLFVSSFAHSDESCECPKLACDPCSVEKGITFFAGKCGPANSKVKSCARPTCVPIDSATAECPHPPAADSGPREPVVVGKAGVPKESAAEESVAPAVGKVKVIAGSASITRADGKKVTVTGEGDIHEGDRIESSADGAALVKFEGGNKLHVMQDTQVEVREFKDSKIEESRRALLHLIKGKIRNQVEQKYNGKTSYYRVTTKGAIAGVRGTDFVVEHSEIDRLETKIETIGGKVMLASLDEKQAVEIARGEGAMFVADLPDPSFRDKDISSFIKRGTLSPVYKIPADKLKELDHNTRADLARANIPAGGKESAICQKPKAFFNQCAWLKTDTACIRKRCNGNGQWAEETKVGNEHASSCPQSGELVRDCDY